MEQVTINGGDASNLIGYIEPNQFIAMMITRKLIRILSLSYFAALSEASIFK